VHPGFLNLSKSKTFSIAILKKANLDVFTFLQNINQIMLLKKAVD